MPTAKSTVAIKRIKRPRVPTTRRRLHFRLSQKARITSKIIKPGTVSKKISQPDFRFYLKMSLARNLVVYYCIQCYATRNFADGRLVTLVTTRTAIWFLYDVHLQ